MRARMRAHPRRLVPREPSRIVPSEFSVALRLDEEGSVEHGCISIIRVICPMMLMVSAASAW
jgi:hypothetical protein